MTVRVNSMWSSQLRVLASRLLHQRYVSPVSSRVAHLVGGPSLQEFSLRSALMTMSAEEAVNAIVGAGVDFSEEYARVNELIAEHASQTDPRYPDYFVVEDGTAYLLYALVRHMRPSIAVELGVADGRSTQLILSAMDANAEGRLISVDIADEVGGSAAGHPRWELRVHVPGRTASRQLRGLLAEVAPLDFFFHDAAHSYYDQYAEYLAGWEHLRPGGLLVSDDVDWSWAFLDVARRVNVKPVVLVDRRKAVGILRRP